MTLLLDHLWQSTVVLAAIGLLTLLFRRNGAHVRHALWTTASLKFLVPFAILNGMGVHLARLTGLRLPPLAAVETLYAAGQPFSDGPIFVAMPMPSPPVWFTLLCAWGASIAALLALWAWRWWTLRRLLAVARAVPIAAPMPVRISPAALEPGLVGIFRPVLLLPEGIADRLTPSEIAAVIAHEACHLRRHDNFLAALHMLVEALFWFWPPVWWLGARLVAERERACDEAVLAAGNDPQTYAEGILKVCKHYIQSPLACAAGIAGANLKHRMETIMENRAVAHLNGLKKSLLAASAAALVLTPLAAGLVWSPAVAAPACAPVAVMATHTLPPYPAKSQKAGETGTVLLRVTISKDGRPSRAAVAKSSGFTRLDLAASDFVQQRYRWRALACGPVQTDLKVVFNLADAREPAGRAKGGQRLQDDGWKGERINRTLPPPARH